MGPLPTAATVGDAGAIATAAVAAGAGTGDDMLEIRSCRVVCRRRASNQLGWVYRMPGGRPPTLSRAVLLSADDEVVVVVVAVVFGCFRSCY